MSKIIAHKSFEYFKYYNLMEWYQWFKNKMYDQLNLMLIKIVLIYIYICLYY